MPLSPGSRFGAFDVIRQLGAGAMGKVYLAEDSRIERRVAIKTVHVHEERSSDDAMLHTRLAREAKASGRLVHPHIVTLFEAGEHEGVFYLAFEYIEGSNLAARMAQPPPLTIDDVIRHAREASSGLAAAHRHGIVHRDIKPSNLLLNENGALKITDFGIAKLLASHEPDLTASGSLIGTPSFLSPEQIRGEELDGRSDLFSLGVVIYQLLAGARPFTGDSVSALLYQILHQEPPLLSAVRPDVPPRLERAVARLMAKDREDRFPSGDALIDELIAIERERAAMASTCDVDGEAVPAVVTRPAVAVAGESPARLGASPLADAAETGARAAPPPHQRRRSAWSLLALVLAVVLLAAGSQAGLGLWWFGRAPSVTNSTPPAVVRPPSPGPIAEPPPTNAPAVRTGADEASAQYRTVGTAVTFAISPPDAGRGAVVRVDGLVRGPAAGSLVTLQPGRHRVEVVAAGYEPFVVLVDAQTGADERGPLAVAMRRATPSTPQ